MVAKDVAVILCVSNWIRVNDLGQESYWKLLGS